MLKFDGRKMADKLEELDKLLRVLFATGIAERQISSYKKFRAFSGIDKDDVICAALDDLWDDPVTGKENEVERCTAVIPGEESLVDWTAEATYAQNAAMSVVYALRARLNGEVLEAVWSAQVAYENVDCYVINHFEIDTNVVGGELSVLSHPLVQAELKRQERDIEEFRAYKANGEYPIVDLIRRRAKLENLF